MSTLCKNLVTQLLLPPAEGTFRCFLAGAYLEFAEPADCPDRAGPLCCFGLACWDAFCLLICWCN